MNDHLHVVAEVLSQESCACAVSSNAFSASAKGNKSSAVTEKLVIYARLLRYLYSLSGIRKKPIRMEETI